MDDDFGNILVVTEPFTIERPNVVFATGILFDQSSLARIEEKECTSMTAYIDSAHDGLASLDNHWSLRENPTESVQNLRVDNFEEVYGELSRLRAQNVILLDLTSSSGRNIRGLQRLCEMSSGKISISYCTSPMDGSENCEHSADFMRSELLVGYQCSPGVYIKSGAIFCQIGTPFAQLRELTALDEAKLTSCALVHSQLMTAPQAQRLPLVIVSIGPFSANHDVVLRILEKNGADLSRTMLNQLIVGTSSIDYYDMLLQNFPINLCFDGFGHSGSFSPRDGPCYPSDEDALGAIGELCRRGYASRLVLSLNIKTKLQLRKYGGHGFTLMENAIIPRITRMTEANEITEKSAYSFDHENIIALTAGNMYNLLHWYKPLPPAAPVVETFPCYICESRFVLGSHYSKFSFNYCSSVCLNTHRKLHWALKTPASTTKSGP